MTNQNPISEADDSGLRHRVENLELRLKRGAKRGMSQVQQSMRTQPLMWAGIAAGTGVALGLVGRFLHWRNRRAVPDLVIIDAAC